MTIRECYARMDADYDGVLGRLGNEERVGRFLLKLPDDKSFENLCGAFDGQDAVLAFRSAHSLKGICLNLGLTRLQASAAALAEDLRGEQFTPSSRELLEIVKRDYQAAAESIGALACS